MVFVCYDCLATLFWKRADCLCCLSVRNPDRKHGSAVLVPQASNFISGGLRLEDVFELIRFSLFCFVSVSGNDVDLSIVKKINAVYPHTHKYSFINTVYRDMSNRLC